MRLIGNRSRKALFTLLAPFYDPLLRPIAGMRRRSIELAKLQPGERVLLVGAGTGLDLPLLPPSLRLFATDITPAMLRRLPVEPHAARALMDGAALAFASQSFDVVILHLIVAVIPDPAGCLREARRVLRPGGRILVLDKFKPPDRPAPGLLRALSPLARLLGTDLTLDLDETAMRAGLRIVHREPGLAGGLFQIARLEIQGE